MTEHARIKRFYLTNHDFQLYVNANCRTYNRSLDDELKSPITVEYYKSLQKGGCNEKQSNGGEDS